MGSWSILTCIQSTYGFIYSRIVFQVYLRVYLEIKQLFPTHRVNGFLRAYKCLYSRKDALLMARA